MDTIEWTPDAVGEAFLMRPGVVMPDWSLVTDPMARKALAASNTAARRAEKWSHIDEPEDRVWQAVLHGFARCGQAPDEARLAAETDLNEPAIVEVVRALRRRDLLVLDERGTAVTAAYPLARGRPAIAYCWTD